MSLDDQQTSKQASPCLTSTAENTLPTRPMAGSSSLTAQSHHQQRASKDENRESNPAPEPSIRRTDTAQSCIVVGFENRGAETSSAEQNIAISPVSTRDGGPSSGENPGSSKAGSIGFHQTSSESGEAEHQECEMCEEWKGENGKSMIMCLKFTSSWPTDTHDEATEASETQADQE